ncbi:MAG TPA: site-specific tyrosine recombinase XerD [Acidimicrobiia bacterium]|nr:site-specific tyrosine recombinase XerD [Acidimicrobiia bacterium]
MGDELDGMLAEYETWLKVERGLAPNSLAAYRRDLRRYTAYLRRRGVTGDVAHVDESVVAGYVDELQQARTDDGLRRYKESSIARALAAVRSFHRFCVEEGLLRSDPSEEVGAPRVPQGIPKALTEAEVEALLDAVPGDGPRPRRDRAILELLYAGGLRISELVGLDLGDVDLYDGLVRVLGKGNKERVAPLGRSAREAVGDYLTTGRPELAGRTSTPALFLNARGGRLTRQGAWLIVRAAGDRAGLQGRLFPHVLRHSCATHMLDRGADIRVVQELLGHASLSTTQVYTKVSPERLRAVYEAAHPRARAGNRGPAREGRQ